MTTRACSSRTCRATGRPGAAPELGERIPLGKAHVVRAGSDVTVISYSRTVNDCVAVADKLAKEGIDVELIDLRTIAPLDTRHRARIGREDAARGDRARSREELSASVPRSRRASTRICSAS